MRQRVGRVTSPGRLHASVFEQRSVLAATSARWDELAIASSRPYSAPGWMLAWWDHLQPAGSTLAGVTLREGSELVGQLPLALTRDRWGLVTGHLLGHDRASFSEPLAKAGRVQEVAAALAVALAGHRDRIDVLSLTAIPHDSPWPQLLQQCWPGPRPRLSLVSTVQAPLVDVPSGGFDEWFGARSRNFRQQTRSRSREFLRRGGSFTRAESPAAVSTGLNELERLHLGRWSDRGGSQALVPGVMQMLRQAAKELGPERMQLWTADVNGGAVAAALLLSAGHELHYWLGGFDESWGSLSLSVLLLVEAVRHAADMGYSRVSLGPGAQPYKYRLATGEQQLDWVDLIPVTLRYPYVRLVQSPRRLHHLASRRMPPGVKQGIRRVAERVSPARSASTDDGP